MSLYGASVIGSQSTDVLQAIASNINDDDIIYYITSQPPQYIQITFTNPHEVTKLSFFTQHVTSYHIIFSFTTGDPPMTMVTTNTHTVSII